MHSANTRRRPVSQHVTPCSGASCTAFRAAVAVHRRILTSGELFQFVRRAEVRHFAPLSLARCTKPRHAAEARPQQPLVFFSSPPARAVVGREVGDARARRFSASSRARASRGRCECRVLEKAARHAHDAVAGWKSFFFTPRHLHTSPADRAAGLGGCPTRRPGGKSPRLGRRLDARDKLALGLGSRAVAQVESGLVPAA